MKRVILFMATLAFLLIMAGGAGASLVVDQQYDGPSNWGVSMKFLGPIGQVFTPTQSNLAAVSASIYRSDSSAYVNIRKDWMDGEILYTSDTYDSTSGWMFEIDPNLWLTVGETYVIEFVATSGNPGMSLHQSAGGGGAFVNGEYRENASCLFRTYYDDAAAPPVPIPGALWLLGSGLVGMIGIHRRTRS